MNRVNDAPHHSALSGGQGDPAHHPAREIAARWGDYLTHDRRRSAHTVRAYGATAHRLIAFLAEHLGGAVDAEALHGRFYLTSLTKCFPGASGSVWRSHAA